MQALFVCGTRFNYLWMTGREMEQMKLRYCLESARKQHEGFACRVKLLNWRRKPVDTYRQPTQHAGGAHMQWCRVATSKIEDSNPGLASRAADETGSSIRFTAK